jgi:hypothetical protein
MKVFVIAIVLNNAYVPLDELKQMKKNQGRIIREEL